MSTDVNDFSASDGHSIKKAYNGEFASQAIYNLFKIC